MYVVFLVSRGGVSRRYRNARQRVRKRDGKDDDGWWNVKEGGDD